MPLFGQDIFWTKTGLTYHRERASASRCSGQGAVPASSGGQVTELEKTPSGQVPILLDNSEGHGFNPRRWTFNGNRTGRREAVDRTETPESECFWSPGLVYDGIR